MKYLQLNIECGKYLEEFVLHVQENDYDILGLQEVGGGKRFQMKHREPGEVDLEKFPTLDCALEIQKRLPAYDFFLSKSNEYPDSYLGNAIFYKRGLPISNFAEVRMATQHEDAHLDPAKFGYTSVFAELQMGNQSVLIGSGHFTWSNRPYDTDLTIQRAAKVKHFIQSKHLPFLFSGDFNVHSQSITVMQFEELGKNLVRELGIRSTLNEKLHRVPALFPVGIACDQLIVSPELIVKNFTLVEADISDHNGLAVEFELHTSELQPVGGLALE